MTGKCGICGDEFDYREKILDDFLIDCLSNSIRIERWTGERLEVYHAKVCDHCAIKMLNYVKTLTYEAKY